jgi:hypothetical protein
MLTGKEEVRGKMFLAPTSAVDSDGAITLRIGVRDARVLYTLFGLVGGDPKDSFRLVTDRLQDLLADIGVGGYPTLCQEACARGMVEFRSKDCTYDDPDSGFMPYEQLLDMMSMTDPASHVDDDGTEPALTSLDGKNPADHNRI